MDQRFILRANRTHKDPPAILHLKAPLPLRRIMVSLQNWRGSAPANFRVAVPIATRAFDDQDAGLIGDQGIDVQFANLRISAAICGQL